MKNKEHSINYLGKTYNTSIHKDLTQKEFENVKKEYYKKPSFEEVQKQFATLELGEGRVNKIVSYYVKDLMAKVKLYYNNWTIEEALNYKPLIEFFAGKSENNKKVYPDTFTLGKKIETAFRLCGFGTASKPSNFPIKTADEILKKYNINNKYYDYSCGWGIRLLSSLRNHIEYYGTDPNYELIDRLVSLSKDYKNSTNNQTFTDIRCQGSEEFVPEWENKFGLAFSSPPYFNLEDYKIGKQSWTKDITYKEWLENYFEITVKNIYNYLIDEGYFIININNYKGCPTLIKDTNKIIINNGFELIETLLLKNITRVSGHKHNDKNNTIKLHNNDEKIFVFKKKGFVRRCTNCNCYMTSGYVIGDGLEYFCSDECLHAYYTEEEYEKECENDNAYWTEWY